MFRSLPAVPQKPDVRLAVADQIPDYTLLSRFRVWGLGFRV